MNMEKKVAVIGAGWAGCHIAHELDLLGVEVVLYEAADSIFSKASGNNQYRLHQGFHYPRSKPTRMQSKNGFDRFLARYPDLSSPTPGRNLYMVPSAESSIDFATYLDIMTMSNLGFDKVDGGSDWVTGVEGAIAVAERVVRTSVAKNYFSTVLKQVLRTGEPVNHLQKTATGYRIEREDFDWVVDATWGQRSPEKNMFYEPALLLYVDPMGFRDALTLVDGSLWSFYPTETDGVFTLSHVLTTSLGRYSSPEQAMARLNSLSKSSVDALAEQMLGLVARNFPAVKDMKVMGHQLSVKSKQFGLADHRVMSVNARGRELRVFSGKIDAIFEMSDKIIAIIGSGRSGAAGPR